MENNKKVIIVLWSDPRAYLAIISASRLLSGRGVPVEIIHRSSGDIKADGDVDFGAKTELRPVGSGNQGWRDKLDFIGFIFTVIFSIWRSRPLAVIGGNALGIAAAFIATRVSPKTVLIYHNFDFNPAAGKKLKFSEKLLQWLEFSGARKADLVIFPHAKRAEVFKEAAKLKQEPLTVMNCYSLGTLKQVTGQLRAMLDSQNLHFDRLVVRLGMIGPHHGIEATIRSVLEWQGNWGLILAGFPVERDYLDKLKELIGQLGLTGKVVILPSVSNSLWNDCLYSAALGISLYEPFNLSHAYMSGTSQKLNNYFVAGIPSIVSNSADFQDFVSRFATSKMADPSDPHSIAQAVNSLLSDREEYARYCRNVRNAFESEFNFEKQFEPVLNWLFNAKIQVK